MFDEEEMSQIKKVLEDSDMAQKYGYGGSMNVLKYCYLYKC
jgi:hypothetical protein